MKIYVPDLENYQCFYVRGEGVIRAYRQRPQNNTTVDYRDYYINSNYIFSDGQQSFSQYTVLPTCLQNSNLSNEVYYRNDFDKILVILLILTIFIIYIPLKIFMRFFRRFH